MNDLNEFFKGKDYSKKMNLFNEKLSEIHKDYNGDFDTDSPYFTMQTHTSKGEIRLDFDIDKDIPSKLKADVNLAFEDIWV